MSSFPSFGVARGIDVWPALSACWFAPVITFGSEIDLDRFLSLKFYQPRTLCIDVKSDCRICAIFISALMGCAGANLRWTLMFAGTRTK